MAERRSNNKKPSRPTIKKRGITAIIGSCKDCNAQWSGGASGIQAVRHFEETGHHIRVDQHTWWERLPRSDNP